jgi:hypothetical protein
MLFDLQGKRRRLVQGVYLTLAILMGVGLVVFGIGSSVSGGLGDLFTGGGGENQGDEIIQKRIDTAETQLEANPRNEAALAQLIRGRYQLATADADPDTGQFSEDARDDLLKARDAWQRYLATNPEKPNVGLARVMIQAYSGLAQFQTDDPSETQRHWAGAAGAIEVIAAQQPNTANYIALVQYASLAGQTNKADLAGKKAVELAPKKQRKAVQQEVESAKASAAQQAGAGGAAAPGGTAP